MDSIVKFVAAKTGLTEDNAKSAIEAIRSYFKTKLPKPVMDLIDKAIEDAE